MWLMTRGKFFAKEFLGIAFDGGEILSVPTFLEQYNKRDKITGLSNPFVERPSDIKKLMALIETNELLIVRGDPGVGKSRLALHVMDLYSKLHPGVQSLCVMHSVVTCLSSSSSSFV